MYSHGSKILSVELAPVVLSRSGRILITGVVLCACVLLVNFLTSKHKGRSPVWKDKRAPPLIRRTAFSFAIAPQLRACRTTDAQAARKVDSSAFHQQQFLDRSESRGVSTERASCVWSTARASCCKEARSKRNVSFPKNGGLTFSLRSPQREIILRLPPPLAPRSE